MRRAFHLNNRCAQRFKGCWGLVAPSYLWNMLLHQGFSHMCSIVFALWFSSEYPELINTQWFCTRWCTEVLAELSWSHTAAGGWCVPPDAWHTQPHTRGPLCKLGCPKCDCRGLVSDRVTLTGHCHYILKTFLLHLDISVTTSQLGMFFSLEL